MCRPNTRNLVYLRISLFSILFLGLFGTATVVVAEPPDVTFARASVLTLWPPNHKFVPISITGITSASGATVTITGCTSDEAVDANTSGVECVDAMMQGSELMLRAERAGWGNGRIYVIHFEATSNDSGHTAAGSVTVCVPHDQGHKVQCTDDGQLYDVTVCPEVVDPAPGILRANYPNPFNPVTQISYELHEETHVRLSVSNTAGRVVATLVNGFEAAGEHTVTWKADGMASGVYFYRITAGSVIETRKMLLVK